MRIQKSNPDGKNKKFERHLKDESNKDENNDSGKNEDTYQSLKESEPNKATTPEEIQNAERLEDIIHPLEEEEKTEDTKSGGGSEHIDLTA